MTIHPEVRIGHVHLTVSDIEKSLAFYRDILGFTVTYTIDTSAVFLSAGGYHHHLALNTWAGKGATPPPRGHTGLYHAAILYPSRRELASALKALLDARYPITGVADHGVSEAIYLTDPDGNGLELYADRPRSEWKQLPGGHIEMKTEPLDVRSLLALLDTPAQK
jgi:catechol 2,3-dioxygenase